MHVHVDWQLIFTWLNVIRYQKKKTTKRHVHIRMWTKMIPFPPSSLYISYKITYFQNIVMKSFLSQFS